MAAPVACGWAGAIFKVSGAFGQEPHAQKPHKRQKSSVMDRRTNGPTKRGVESRSTRLKTKLYHYRPLKLQFDSLLKKSKTQKSDESR